MTRTPASQARILLAAIVLIVLACDALSRPLLPLRPGPTPPPAQRTLKRVYSPTPPDTATPRPTRTPTPAPSPTFDLSHTPDLPFAVLTSRPTRLPTRTPGVPTPASELSCRLVWQSPRNGVTFAPLVKFTAGWNLENDGTATWDAGTFEFTYLGGSQLHNTASFPLDESVSPGDSIILSVPMKAPLNPTKYTTWWGLRRGADYFCRLKLQIAVE